MSPDQRARAEKDLRDGARDLARKQGEVQDDFNARRNEEMSRLQRTLIEEVRTYAKAQSFDLIIADGVIYSTPSLDITPAILDGAAGPGAETCGRGTGAGEAPGAIAGRARRHGSQGRAPPLRNVRLARGTRRPLRLRVAWRSRCAHRAA